MRERIHSPLPTFAFHFQQPTWKFIRCTGYEISTIDERTREERGFGNEKTKIGMRRWVGAMDMRMMTEEALREAVRVGFFFSTKVCPNNELLEDGT